MQKVKVLARRCLCAFLVSLFAGWLTGEWVLKAQNAPDCASAQMSLLKEVIEIEAKNLSFDEFFSLINSKLSSPLYISYRVEDLSVMKKVSMEKRRSSVENILRDVLEGYQLTFMVKDNIVMIDRKEVMQQQKKPLVIKGKVLEHENGEPIIGATILIKGTTVGTSTDLDGTFTIPVELGKTLVVSFIGKTSQEVKVESDKFLTIKLKNDQIQMDEVVVTGYANINKNTFTGNVKTIKNEELMKVSRTNVLKAISTFDPSFRIAENNIFGSDPNALPEINIRGHSSIGTMQLDKDKFSKANLEKNPNTPTFIMDGFEVMIDRKEVMQQQKKPLVIKGKVLEHENGEPIIGATILIKGTTVGAATDLDGVFTIPVEVGNTLVISFIGKTPQEIKVESDKFLTIKLKNDQIQMDEVVVTGYANINKNTFTGNVKTIKSDELMKVSRTNVLKAISTFDPSFRIAENNIFGSDPNALPEINIRGHSSIGTMELDKDKFSKGNLDKNPNTPTFIMDGFEVDIQKVYDMDPNRIENITILKDAAATAMYGSRAANGVVVITTKAPKAGKVQVSYNFTSTLEVPDLRDYNLMNSKEKFEAEILAGVFEPKNIGFPYGEEKLYWEKYNAIYVEGVETDWMSLPLRNAFQHRHSLNVESGNENIRYSFDLNYSGNNGVMKGSGRNNVGAGFKVYITLGRFQLSNSVTYNNMTSEESPYGSFGDYTHLLPYNRITDKKGNLLEKLNGWGAEDKPNPLYEASLGNFDKSKDDEIINNLQIRWDLGKGFMAQASIGLEKSWSEDRRFIDPKSRNGSQKLSNDNLLAGDLYTTDGKSSSWNTRLGLSYNANLGRNNLNFSLIGEIDQRNSYSVATHYVGFAAGTSADINYASKVQDKPVKAENVSRYAGLNGIFNYSFDNIYLADLSIRYEGSSLFGKEQQSTPYWSGENNRALLIGLVVWD